MSRNKKPVLIVAVVLAALIIIPLILLLVSRMGGSGGGGLNDSNGNRGSAPAEVADFDLRQLADRANQLIEQDMAEALRKNDVTLAFMSGLKRDADRAAESMARGRLDQARASYERVIEATEARLSAIALADQAREMSGSTYAELQKMEYLKANFEHTYNEAVANYNSGLKSLNAANYQAAVDDFEMSLAILGDLEARAIQQIANMLEAGNQALETYELERASRAFESALALDRENKAAADGLAMVVALDGISEAVKTIRALEAAGQLEAALAELELLAKADPENPFIRKQRSSLQARIADRDFKALVAQSKKEEAADDYVQAIQTLETALKIKDSAEQAARLADLKERTKAMRLELLLADGYDALTAGRYESARNFYREAVALDPDSKEARTGLERSSSLYLANIRYIRNLEAASRYIEEGRFPLAANLFNEAMASRPGNVASSQAAEEARIRQILEQQSVEVSVRVVSDRRTFVSMIGVFPPDRFAQKELKLFPDVYKLRGTRSGYQPVEIEFKVDATQPNARITVECT
ncbi:MAG: hypothetical protein EA353_12960 [Puniceicoccaceae bacterium]|nr:MAG: hypothetical protein EA353_12960 [Puniceicoccaceae bacterium]